MPIWMVRSPPAAAVDEPPAPVEVLEGPPAPGSSPAPSPSPPPASTKVEAPAAPGLDDLVLIMRPRGRTPTWLKPYQERLAKASRTAGEQTLHLQGLERKERMLAITSQEMARLKAEEAGGA